MKREFLCLFLCCVMAVTLEACSCEGIQPGEQEEEEEEETVVARTILEGNYTDIALSPDGERLYVIEYGPGGEDNEGSVAVMNTSNEEVVATITGLGVGFPARIVTGTSPQGDRAYVCISQAAGATTTSGTNHVTFIDIDPDSPTYHQVLAITPISGSAYGVQDLVLGPDGERVYVVHRGLSKIDAIDTSTYQIVASLQLDAQGAVGIAVTPDGELLYVAGRGDSTVWVVRIHREPDSLEFVKQIPLDVSPTTSSTYVTITPDGERVFVTYDQDHRIAVIDVDDDEVRYIETSTIDVGGSYFLREIAIVSPENELALLCSNTYSVLVIDITNEEEIDKILVGHGTFYIAYDADDLVPGVIAYVSGREKVTAILELPEFP